MTLKTPWLLLMAAICWGVLLSGCDKPAILEDDLAMAREAYAEGNIPLTERLVERYLRSGREPEKRWEAWDLLLKAINADRPQPRASLECLEAMLADYAEDDGKLAVILPQMGKYGAMLRHYDRAADAWSAYLELDGLDDAARVEGFRRLAAMQFGQRHFEAGEETLQQCLALPIPDHDKIHCMLDLADENAARERWRESADLCEQIFDAEPDGEARGRAGYLLADALERMGRLEEALAWFEKARDNYPNPLVMDNRIEYLKKNIKTKKDSK